MKIARCVIAAATLASCSPPLPGPTAIARFVEPSQWTADDRSQIGRGLAAWRELGFKTDVEKITTLPPCPNDWYKHSPQIVACVITIALRRETGMIATYKQYAQSNRDSDTTSIDATLHGDRLRNVMAHEAGHILLNTAQHTTYGALAPGGDYDFVSGNDMRLACSTIQRGCQQTK